MRDNLPFITITIAHKGKVAEIPDVLVDTGSASTVVSADILSTIEITPALDDVLHTIQGVGGSEVVFTRKVDTLKVGEYCIDAFSVEIGKMDYGFRINGILGMDYLIDAGATINLKSMEIDFSN
ncbi:MAG: aspartyl protease family protein [Anaerolineae bacterium]|nr:aspartyl protease family protein [Anaerolineae bacterium]